MANRRKHANSIPFAFLVKCVVAFVFLIAVGLGYVSKKNHLHATGTEIKRLEHQITDLGTAQELIHVKINALSSRSALQRRLNEGFIKMIPIADNRIVRLHSPAAQLAELRPVSNQTAVK